MSEHSTTHGFWFRRSDPLTAGERLRKVVAALTRARRLQVLVDYGFGGLLAGLGLATIAVLAARMMPLPWLPWQVAGAAVIGALALALAAGWWKRPDSLGVAIRADLRLKLKQRLSTAWEFMTVHGDGELTERLAVQAVNAGLPTHAGAVFPLRVNRWGLLAPLAAGALLLVSVIEFDRVQQAPPVHATDARVMSEGERLGAFGRAMQERAARERLPRSARQGAELERLGTRMESGALTRSQALGELRRRGESLDEERRQALADAKGAGDSPRAQGRQGSPATSGLNPEAMLDRMRRGALDSADIRALSRYLEDLERSGTPHEELEKALRRHRAGADEALKEILENLARTERGRKEDKELANARAQVRRAQENLGDSSPTARGRGPGAGIEWDEDESEDVARGDAGKGAQERLESRATRGASRSASQGDSSIAADRSHSPYRPEPGPRGPVLKPEGEMRAGESFTSHARLPPKSGRPSVGNVELAREFAPQVEEVLSRDQYPPHYKEFVRRYFLNLSRGARAAPESPGAEGPR